jgi:transposase
LYLNKTIKKDEINDKISIPILIDSTGLQNNIKTHLTAISNHNGDINNEIRLIYVIDKKTKMPIFFRIVPGNIIDNSTLINTINMLHALNINVELLLIDAGYSSKNNILQLLETKIPFLTRLTKNRKEYKDIINKYGSDLEQISNMIEYGDRILFGRKVQIEMHKTQLYAYIMLDGDRKQNDIKNIAKNFFENPDNKKTAENKLVNSGKFILISSLDIEINEILPLYYQRQSVEQIFDISKTYANVTTLRGHSEETIRGILLICFISTIIYSLISCKLTNTKYSAFSAIKKLHYLRIKLYNKNITIIEELDKEQKEIFAYLNLEFPFGLEIENTLKKDSFLESLKVLKRKRGRPFGSNGEKRSTKTPELVLQNDVSSLFAEKRSRGRPKGSKNKPKTDQRNNSATLAGKTGQRGRGRPKSSNKKHE